MKSSVFISYFLFGMFTLFIGCKPEEPLPILGFPDVDENGVEVSHQVADFIFTDHNAEPFSSKGSKGIFVMNYFFTSCPTVCPKMTDEIANVFDVYQKDEKVHFFSFSVDPDRDNPARLQGFMESHHIPLHENWYFLTGEKKMLYDFARYQLFLSALEADVAIDDDFIHSEKVVLVDQNRHIRGYYTGTEAAEMKRLKKDIARLQRER